MRANTIIIAIPTAPERTAAAGAPMAAANAPAAILPKAWAYIAKVRSPISLPRNSGRPVFISTVRTNTILDDYIATVTT